MEIETFILEYIEAEYSLPADIDGHDLNYAEEGYIDSMGMIQFVVALEDEFQITFTEEELNSPEFKVVGSLADLIQKKMENVS